MRAFAEALQSEMGGVASGNDQSERGEAEGVGSQTAEKREEGREGEEGGGGGEKEEQLGDKESKEQKWTLVVWRDSVFLQC